MLTAEDVRSRFAADRGYDVKDAVRTLSAEKFASGEPAGQNEPMSDTVTRPELDAKLETIEARMDGRVARIEDSIQRIAADVATMHADSKSLRTTILITAVTSVIAIVFGIAAFNATLLSNMIASFESGKDTAAAITQSSEQLKQTQAELEKLRQEIAASRPVKK